MTEKPSKSLAVAGEQETWTRTQLNALRRVGFDAPPRDMDLLFHAVKQTALDPFKKQLYMARNERGEWEVRTTQAGLLTIARRVANERGEGLAISAPEWADETGKWHTVWPWPQPPAAARVTIHRAGQEFTETCMFHEYAVFDDATGRLNRTWQKRGSGQLAKCSRAAGLRMAFPDEMSGLYIDEEMRPDTVAGAVVVAADDPGQRSELDNLLAEDD